MVKQELTIKDVAIKRTFTFSLYQPVNNFNMIYEIVLHISISNCFLLCFISISKSKAVKSCKILEQLSLQTSAKTTLSYLIAISKLNLRKPRGWGFHQKLYFRIVFVFCSLYFSLHIFHDIFMVVRYSLHFGHILSDCQK